MSPPPEKFSGERSGRNQKCFSSPDLPVHHTHSPPLAFFSPPAAVPPQPTPPSPSLRHHPHRHHHHRFIIIITIPSSPPPRGHGGGVRLGVAAITMGNLAVGRSITLSWGVGLLNGFLTKKGVHLGRKPVRVRLVGLAEIGAFGLTKQHRESDIQEKEQKESQKQSNSSTGWKTIKPHPVVWKSVRYGVSKVRIYQKSQEMSKTGKQHDKENHKVQEAKERKSVQMQDAKPGKVKPSSKWSNSCQPSQPTKRQNQKYYQLLPSSFIIKVQYGVSKVLDMAYWGFLE
ncbi:hypothetical protein Tco_0830463 [Tanacetum coccineum]